ncbi:hypothetical protein PHYBLDRAFT_157038 [Phycomyces blakesleeanus NRRL 1555(-)]|uniref:Uncharacterized protein n=1 Tax=Phycomyces blakesleeanus (strain ATCC 8743b / DSM 1359 / FGSC 10004 / NBRC 33097 / NRRL 1555) TaxID=763407 RepID=A0A163ER24_PHYB8|nr:hypothetical protein PHYBLDRAFT_157038 [Phycomyces blakesleeanus NRRL 1555(-)]OAD80970.1 hypothetical protein PHYBLDRAFT_157038 [Phycomyces blakesleeanus NRRL 1555(-)]|eukprot:XP_018299010.1 hypothetical protein PHYBLDRAFT_157038 [Phycomyces blakesleeanus NRRL 1555(-)]
MQDKGAKGIQDVGSFFDACCTGQVTTMNVCVHELINETDAGMMHVKRADEWC